ncbi:MAG: molybdate ABC transporter permease subunit [Oscillospiraceae bacterium]
MKNKNIFSAACYFISFVFIICPLFSFFTRNFFGSISSVNMSLLMNAIKTSLICSVTSIIIVFVFGVPCAYFMAKSNFKFKEYVDMLFNIPMVLPPAVIGLILLITFGKNGYIGKYLYAMGIQVTFSKVAVVIALVFVSLPVFVGNACESFKKVPKSLVVTAMTLGDSPLRAFLNITYPLSKSGVYTALIMAWARGLAEFGATMMFAGNVKGITQTLPLAIYSAMESNMESAMIMSFIMIVIAVGILASVHIISKRLNQKVK